MMITYGDIHERHKTSDISGHPPLSGRDGGSRIFHRGQDRALPLDPDHIGTPSLHDTGQEGPRSRAALPAASQRLFACPDQAPGSTIREMRES